MTTTDNDKNNKRLRIALIFLVTAVVLLCCAFTFGRTKDEAEGIITPEATFGTSSTGEAVGALGATAAKSAAPKVKPTAVVLTAGDYEIAKTTSADALTIAPGTYAIKADGYHCYWARLKGFSGELDDIIANDNLFNGATARVTVKRSDKGLKLTGNCEARRK